MFRRDKASAQDPAIERRIEASYRNLDRTINWIQNADNKALIILGFQGALLAGLGAAASSVIDIARSNLSSWSLGAFICLLIAFAISFALCLYKATKAMFPDTKERNDSVFYFGSITSMGYAAFEKRMTILDSDKIQEELNKQTHANAEIAVKKFDNLKLAMRWLVREAAFLLIAMTIIVVLVANHKFLQQTRIIPPHSSRLIHTGTSKRLVHATTTALPRKSLHVSGHAK